MLVNISRNKIVKDEANHVTSHLIYTPYYGINREVLKFHEDGIFSKKIFGNFYKCECGNLKRETGFCKECSTRVIDRKNIPNFYIDLPCHVLVAFAQIEKLIKSYNGNFKLDVSIIKYIMNYRLFIYNDQFYIFDDDNNIFAYGIDESEVEPSPIDKDTFNNELIYYGIEALRYLDIDEEWIYENLDDYICIPHTIYRPIIISTGDLPLVTGINKMYSSLVQKVNNITEMGVFVKDKKFFAMIQYRSIVDSYNNIIEKLFNELQDNKYSIIRSEIISHPISGAIRATLTNRYDIGEDIILIGDTLIKTLYPYLYEKYDGDMIKINKELIDTDAKVLVNRPPTISHMSIIACKPRVASLYPYGHIDGSYQCNFENTKYIEENFESIGFHKNGKGDIEKYSSKIDEDGIDTIGLRVVSINPIIADGLAGDFDGDVLLVIALYSDKAKKEAENMLPSNNFMNYANGTIRNHIVEDLLFDSN